MRRIRPRWVLADARRRVVALLKRARVALLRRHTSSRVLPPPRRRARGRPPLRLTHALVASDLNVAYVDAWSLAKRAWPEVAGLEPVLVLVAPADAVPPELADDPCVRVFEPLEGVHTALQAQCVRLVYPALLSEAAGVLTADVDMLPLDRAYFHAPATRTDASDFVAYRDVLLPIGQIPICYNAAAPSTWAEIFGVTSLEDARRRIAEWADAVDYDGSRGGSGWDTDQLVLHRTLLAWGERTRRAWILDDDETRHRRLDRSELVKRRALNGAQRRRLRSGVYTDFHCLLPNAEYAALNDEVIDYAAARARG